MHIVRSDAKSFAKHPGLNGSSPAELHDRGQNSFASRSESDDAVTAEHAELLRRVETLSNIVSDAIAGQAGQAGRAYWRVDAAHCSPEAGPPIPSELAAEWIVNRGGVSVGEIANDVDNPAVPTDRAKSVAGQFEDKSTILWRASERRDQQSFIATRRSWFDPVRWFESEFDHWAGLTEPRNTGISLFCSMVRGKLIWQDAEIMSRIMDDLICAALGHVDREQDIRVTMQTHPESADWLTLRVTAKSGSENQSLAGVSTSLAASKRWAQCIDGHLDLRVDHTDVEYSLHIPANNLFSWMRHRAAGARGRHWKTISQSDVHCQLFEIHLTARNRFHAQQDGESLDAALQETLVNGEAIIQLDPSTYLLASLADFIGRTEIVERVNAYMLRTHIANARAFQPFDFAVTPLGSLEEVLARIDTRIQQQLGMAESTPTMAIPFSTPVDATRGSFQKQQRKWRRKIG